MRILLFLLLTTSIYSQRLIRTPYEQYMEARAIKNLDFNLNTEIKKERMLTLRPMNRVKITVKTRLNRDILSKIDVSNGDINIFDDLETGDYISLGAYDVRCKVYVTKKLRIITRVLITGIKIDTYFYSSGIMIKF